MWAMGISLFLSSLKTVPSVILEREIQFNKLIIPQIVESLVFNIILIASVLLGRGIDSYSLAFFVSGLIGIPFYYYVSPSFYLASCCRDGFGNQTLVEAAIPGCTGRVFLDRISYDRIEI